MTEETKLKTWRAVDRTTGERVLEGFRAASADEAWAKMRTQIGGTPPETAMEAGLEVEEELPPAEGGAQGACILTGAPGENEEDCTTHAHESGQSPAPSLSAYQRAVRLVETHSKRGTHEERRDFLLDAFTTVLQNVPDAKLVRVLDDLESLVVDEAAEANAWVVAWDRNVNEHVALVLSEWNNMSHDAPVERGLAEDVAVARAALRNTYLGTPAIQQALREAERMWDQRCAQYLMKHGDQGTCVVGAAICVDVGVQHFVLIPAPKRSQGSLAWEESKDEVLRFLAERGLPDAYYFSGSMD